VNYAQLGSADRAHSKGFTVTRWFALSSALLVAGCATATAGGGESISTDLGISHWVPRAQVDLDLATGRYQLRPGRPPTVPEGTIISIRTGRLAGEELRLVRERFAAALSQGVIEPDCENGLGAPFIVLSTRPTPLLVLRSGARTIVAPHELGCWAEAVRALRSTLHSSFGWRLQELSPNGRRLP
jgi:hypothetical protein